MKELAEFLQSERSKRGLTLEVVSERSGISIKMLTCFESGEFECLGASLLIRNTVRGYCGVLDLDAEPLLREYADGIEKHNYQEEGIKKYAQLMKVLRKRRRMVSLPLMLLAVMTAGLMYAGTWISEKRARLYTPPAAERISSQEDLPDELRQKLVSLSEMEARKGQSPTGGSPYRLAARSAKSDKDLREAEKAIQEAEKNIQEAEKAKEAARTGETEPVQKAVKQSEPLPEPSPRMALSNSMEVMADDRPAAVQEPGKRYRFSVEASDKTWVQVKIDEKETRGAMLHPGDKREWTAQKGMQVVIGNAGGVNMKWDDQQIKASHDSGRVLRFKLPEQLSVD